MSARIEKAAFTLDDFCDYASLGKTSTYKAIKEGRLKVAKFGRRTLVMKPEADRFLASLVSEAA